MASTPPTEEAFIREVADELRREQMVTMWKRYGLLALLAIILALAAFAAFLFWRSEVQKKAEAQGEEMAAIITDIQQKRPGEAGKKIDRLVAEGSSGYRAAALFAKAAIAADQGDGKTAATIYAGIAADEKVGQPYRDVALIRQTMVEYESLSPQQVIDRMKPLAQQGSAFFGSAGELTALALLQTNRPAEAGRLLAAIAADRAVPASLRGRAERLANSLGVEVDVKTADKE